MCDRAEGHDGWTKRVRYESHRRGICARGEEGGRARVSRVGGRRETGLSDPGLFAEEGKVHLPDTRHLVEQNEGPFEQGIDLLVFGGMAGGIARAQMGHA